MKRLGLPLAAIAALSAAACCPSPAPRAPAAPTGGGAAQPAAPPFPTPAPPEGLRLGDDVAPVRQSLDLQIDPNQLGYRGVARIEVTVGKAIDQVWLNGKVDVRSVEVRQGGTLPARLVPPDARGVFGILLGGAGLQPGKAELVIEFWANAPDDETSGPFRRKVGDDWYLFTDFEPMDARMAFPCFDQPTAKIPWTITVTVPEGNVVYGNQPVAKQTPAKGGTTVFELAPSPPLATYFVAIAVGPFASVSQDDVGVVFPRTYPKEQAAHTLSEYPKVRDALAAYFGRPYPYAKLDVIAVPGLGPGAMENPGLITFKSQYLLRPAHEWTLAHRQSNVAIGAHELAHMWFGDLVTAAWWDDIWLSEAFATWAANKATHTLHPDWDVDFWSVSQRKNALDADAVPSIRRIRQPVVTVGDAFDAFDSITYEKGGAVLRMFELWMGAEAFQKGVQLYLQRHEHGSATADDFLAALGEASGKDVKSAFSSFLDQSGVPLVGMQLDCAVKNRPALVLTQARFRLVGVEPPPEPQLWKIPVCVRWAVKKTSRSECFLFEAGTARFDLPGTAACPKWLVPNDGGRGYYHADVWAHHGPPDVRGGMTSVERAAWATNVGALVRTGRPADRALETLKQLGRDPNAYVVAQTIDVVRDLARELERPVGNPLWAAYVRDVFGPQARKLGWTPKKGEALRVALLRPRIMEMVGADGGDPDVAREARELADDWLDDRASVDAELVPAALAVAAAHGDEALYDRVLAALRGSTEPGERRMLLETLAAFRAPKLVARSLDLLLDPATAPYEYRWLLWPLAENRHAADATYAYVKANFDALAKRAPSHYPGRFPETARHLCRADDRAEVEAFFRERMKALPSGERVLTQVLEEIGGCHNIDVAQAEPVAKYLSVYGPRRPKRSK